MKKFSSVQFSSVQNYKQLNLIISLLFYLLTLAKIYIKNISNKIEHQSSKINSS